MNLFISDKEIFEKYNEIWNKIKNLFEKEFDSEPMCNDKSPIKTPIEGEHYTCFSVNTLCSCLSRGKINYLGC